MTIPRRSTVSDCSMTVSPRDSKWFYNIRNKDLPSILYLLAWPWHTNNCVCSHHQHEYTCAETRSQCNYHHGWTFTVYGTDNVWFIKLHIQLLSKYVIYFQHMEVCHYGYCLILAKVRITHWLYLQRIINRSQDNNYQYYILGEIK